MELNLFPCPILYIEAPVDVSKINSELKNDWQSTWIRGEFTEGTELYKFKKFVIDTAHSYFNNCGFNDVQLRSTNVWLNNNHYGDYIQPHHHGAMLVSWSYYLNTDEDTGDIIFIDPKGNNSWSYFTTLQLHPDKINGTYLYKISPKPNHIVIFPGWLQHLVEPNKSKNMVRTSISGDLHTKDFVDYYETASTHAQRDLSNHTNRPKDHLE
jgi:hypothetical protein